MQTWLPGHTMLEGSFAAIAKTLTLGHLRSSLSAAVRIERVILGVLELVETPRTDIQDAFRFAAVHLWWNNGEPKMDALLNYQDALATEIRARGQRCNHRVSRDTEQFVSTSSGPFSNAPLVWPRPSVRIHQALLARARPEHYCPLFPGSGPPPGTPWKKLPLIAVELALREEWGVPVLVTDRPPRR